ncbi:MAG: TetR/AcrR family transcriptional regulator [Jatrophihabitantaceae bacterium]
MADARPITSKGKQTRDRIVAAAADLMVARGIASVSLDEVGRATSTSKSQMYHYFNSKDDLVMAVVEHVGEQILAFQGNLLQEMKSLEDVERWANAIVVHQRQSQPYCGCPLGTLAGELSGNSLQPQPQIDAAFAAWQLLLETGLSRMVANGQLRPNADPQRLAISTLAALQGGLLLSKATQDESSLRVPLDTAVDYLRSFLVA